MVCKKRGVHRWLGAAHGELVPDLQRLGGRLFLFVVDNCLTVSATIPATSAGTWTKDQQHPEPFARAAWQIGSWHCRGERRPGPKERSVVARNGGRQRQEAYRGEQPHAVAAAEMDGDSRSVLYGVRSLSGRRPVGGEVVVETPGVV